MVTSAGPRRLREVEIIVARGMRRLFIVITAGMVAVAPGPAAVRPALLGEGG